MGEEDKADRGRGWKTTSANGQAWSSPSHRGQWRTGKNGGNWLQNHLWCPSDPRGEGIDYDDDDDVHCHQLLGLSLPIVTSPWASSVFVLELCSCTLNCPCPQNLDQGLWIVMYLQLYRTWGCQTRPHFQQGQMWAALPWGCGAPSLLPVDC